MPPAPHAPPPISAALVQDLAACAGLRLTAERAEALAPHLEALLVGAQRLQALDLGPLSATAPLWPEAPRDGR